MATMYSFACIDTNGGHRNYYRTASKESMCVLGADGKTVLQCPEDIDHTDTIVLPGGVHLSIREIALSGLAGWVTAPPTSYRWWLEFTDGTRASYLLREPDSTVYQFFPEQENGAWVPARTVQEQAILWHPRANKYGLVVKVHPV